MEVSTIIIPVKSQLKKNMKNEFFDFFDFWKMYDQMGVPKNKSIRKRLRKWTFQVETCQVKKKRMKKINFSWRNLNYKSSTFSKKQQFWHVFVTFSLSTWFLDSGGVLLRAYSPWRVLLVTALGRPLEGSMKTHLVGKATSVLRETTFWVRLVTCFCWKHAWEYRFHGIDWKRALAVAKRPSFFYHTAFFTRSNATGATSSGRGSLRSSPNAATARP